MKVLVTLSPVLFLVLTGCPPAVAPPPADDAGVTECAVLDAGCSETQACCAGASCFAGQCACVQLAGSACGGANPVCCDGLSCDATGHCQSACSGAAGSCRAPADSCTTTADCCTPATCVKGACSLLPPRCAEDGEECTTEADCCGSPAVFSRPACVARGATRICHFGRKGEACTGTQVCIPALTCVIPTPDAGLPADAGAPLDAGAASDAGLTGDGGLLDDGGVVDDGGITDAGVEPDAGADAGPALDAGAPADAGVPVGVCGVLGTPPDCTLRGATCSRGSSCNPNSSANQGYDPCTYRYNGSSLLYRSPTLVCHSGVCALPQLFESCSTQCGTTAGVARKPECVQLDANSQLCLEPCTTNADCPGTFFPSGDLTSSMASGMVSPVPLTMWCVPHPERGRSYCQPKLCYEDAPDRDNPGALYKPCPGLQDSLCIPHEGYGLNDYFGSSNVSTSYGFCQALRPGTGSTIGTPCDVRAGTEARAALCGADATCVGGICQRTCDAALPGNDYPTCPPTEVCHNPYLGTDPLAGFQAGICGPVCDPFADEAHSGCSSYCGGPRSRCQWQGLDRVPAVAHCETAAANPKSAGQQCAASLECQTGLQCWQTAASSPATCVQLCSLTAPAGHQDACRQGTCQPLYDGAKKIGGCF